MHNLKREKKKVSTTWKWWLKIPQRQSCQTTSNTFSTAKQNA